MELIKVVRQYCHKQSIKAKKYIKNKEQNQKEEIEEQKNNIENLEENNIQNELEE